MTMIFNETYDVNVKSRAIITDDMKNFVQIVNVKVVTCIDYEHKLNDQLLNFFFIESYTMILELYYRRVYDTRDATRDIKSQRSCNKLTSSFN